jgi:hypothetical protein
VAIWRGLRGKESCNSPPAWAPQVLNSRKCQGAGCKCTANLQCEAGQTSGVAGRPLPWEPPWHSAAPRARRLRCWMQCLAQLCRQNLIQRGLSG